MNEEAIKIIKESNWLKKHDEEIRQQTIDEAMKRMTRLWVAYRHGEAPEPTYTMMICTLELMRTSKLQKGNE
ncbi:MAG: hypothetical protein MJZ20_13390 [Bacteroidaceae bacterium]|nr:hypothetical protein [Bacteroidaceae bacterium]